MKIREEDVGRALISFDDAIAFIEEAIEDVRREYEKEVKGKAPYIQEQTRERYGRMVEGLYRGIRSIENNMYLYLKKLNETIKDVTTADKLEKKNEAVSE